MFSIESRAPDLKYYENIHFLVYSVPFPIASSLSSGSEFTLPRNMPYDVTSVQMSWLAETSAYNSVSQPEPATLPAEGGREVYLAPWAINHLLNFYVCLWASVISGWALERVKAATSTSPESSQCLLPHWHQCSSATRELDCWWRLRHSFPNKPNSEIKKGRLSARQHPQSQKLEQRSKENYGVLAQNICLNMVRDFPKEVLLQKMPPCPDGGESRGLRSLTLDFTKCFPLGMPVCIWLPYQFACFPRERFFLVYTVPSP